MDDGKPIAALEELLTAKGEHLRRTATLLTGSPGEGEDLLQTALERTFRRWRSVGDPEGYLRRTMYNWQVTALGDGALEPYGQIAGPCLARFTSLAIQVPDTSTKMDGSWLVRLVPGTRSARQGMTPWVRSGSRQQPAVHVTGA